MRRIRLDRPLPKKAVSESRPDAPGTTETTDADPDFEALMKRSGVTPLADDAPAPRPNRPNGPKTTGATSSAPRPEAGDMSPDPPAEAEGSPSGTLPSGTLPSGALPSAGARLDEAVVDRLKAENESLSAQIEQLREERDRIDTERRTLSRRLSEMESAPSPEASRFSLSALLDRRGCRTREEREACLRHLIESKALDAFLERAIVSESRELDAILDAAVSFVCGREECRPAAGSTPLVVEAHRCEVCGGSDLRLAAKKLFDACLEKGLKRIRVVGGSPTYHTQLRELAADSPIELKLISGVDRRTEREAKADQKHSDLVVLWGATLLDHSTSGLYERSRSWIVTVPHRGLAGMMERLAEKLATPTRK